MNKLLKTILLLIMMGPAAATNAAKLSDLISSNGSLTNGDKVFDHFGWSSSFPAASVNITTIGDGTANNLYGIEIQAGFTQLGIGTLQGQLTYSVHTVGNFLISDIQQFVNVLGVGKLRAFVNEQVSTDQSGTPVVAQSTVGLDSTTGPDFTDPPAELNDGAN